MKTPAAIKQSGIDSIGLAVGKTMEVCHEDYHNTGKVHHWRHYLRVIGISVISSSLEGEEEGEPSSITFFVDPMRLPSDGGQLILVSVGWNREEGYSCYSRWNRPSNDEERKYSLIKSVKFL